MQLANITSTYRARIISKVYKKWIKSHSTVLDVGCGNGIVTKTLSQSLNIKAYGCDILNYLKINLEFKTMKNFSKLPYKNSSFDYVMFNDVLHHTELDNQIVLIKEALRVSRTVLLFEVYPTISGRTADYILNKIHNPKMNIPFTFRTTKNWQQLFRENKIKFEFQKAPKPRFYPFTHIAFKLTK